MSHDNHFNFEVNKSPKNGKQKKPKKCCKKITLKRNVRRYHRKGEKGGLTIRWVAFENKSKCLYVLAEMEKRADSADISVLFFLIAVLIFWLYTRKQTVLFCTVLLALYY